MAIAGITKVAPIGKRFGKLTVCSPSRPSGTARNASVVDCRCDCGDVRPYFIGNLPKMKEPMCPECKPAHRPSKGQWRHPLYNIWKGIIQRCENPNHTHYADYGGRGIAICQRWRDDFEAFVADMGERPSPGHTVDRIDGARGYEPGNVRWATQLVQMRNTRRTRMIEWQGRDISMSEAAEIAGISKELFHWRLKREWPIDKIMSTPSREARQ